MCKSSLPTRDPLAGLIVYEDRDLLVVNKPAGMLTASGPRDKRPTLWRAVQLRGMMMRQKVGIIHRLDRDAAGLLVFSKNDDAYQSLKKQFFRHTVERMYMAIVHGTPKPPSGSIRSRLVEWKDGTVHSTKRPGKGELAVSHYEVHATEQAYSLVRVKLETGRKHQIRVHLADMGHPIVGDEFYGNQRGRRGKREPENLMLAAIRLCFDHPRGGKRMEFEIDLPGHMRQFIRSIRARSTNDKQG